MNQQDAHSLLAAVPLPLVLIGADERITAINPMASDLFGQGAQGRNYVTFLRQPLLLDCIEAALRLNQAGEARITVSETGRDSEYLVRAVPANDGVLVSFEDTTALQQAGQMRRDFVANVSHELRTPLTALLGFIETLRGPARDDASVRARFLGIMEHEASRMNRLVSDLLSLSRVEGEARVRPMGQVDIAAQISMTIERLRPLAEAQNMALSIEGVEASVMIPGDADQLGQVLSNLIENAIKYGRKAGQGAGEVSICLTAHDQEPTLRAPAVRIDVADTGDGIDTAHIPRLTERFYRVDGHRSREMGGTGLGLAIVKHIVNRHRGRMRIESHKGQGSCFSVILPAT
ncbi:MAG: two-component system phosphate regulon sensor histidine kinase PhoR [Halocynthiibacter sp.]|jgi:two-component system phosphate regulon sensor histidine kinase PhoR